MKKLLAILFMMPVIVFSQPNDIQIKQFNAYCLNLKQLEKLLDDFEEKSFIRMFSVRPGAENRWETYSAVMFMSKDGKSWSLVEKRGENLYCVIGMGREVEPVSAKEEV